MKKSLQVFCLVLLLGMVIAGPAFAGGQEILVASPIPLTGPYASDGEVMKQVYEMAVDEYNAQGGLLGRKLKIQFGDIGTMEPEKVKSVGERLLAEKPDLIITGYDNSGVFVFGEYDIPYLHQNGMSELTEPVAKNPDKYWNVFHYAFTENYWGDTAMNTFVESSPKMLGWKPPNRKVAVITVDFSYSSRAAARFVELAGQMGYDVVVNETINFGVAEYGPILSKIESQEPAFILMFHVVPDDPARFLTQFRDYFDDGYNGLLWMQYVPSIPEFKELAGKAAEGLIFGSVGMGFTEKSRDYIKRWTKRYGKPPVTFQAMLFRDAFDLWAAAVKRAGCTDCYREVARQMREYPHTSLEGFLMVFNQFDQSLVPGDGLVFTNLLQWQGNKQVALLPKRLAQGEIQTPPWLKK